MRELVSEQPGAVTWREYDDPPLQPGQVRIESLLTAVKHGTEAGLVERTDPMMLRRFDPALAAFGELEPGESLAPDTVRVGNMTVGRVLEVAPGVDGLEVGAMVYGWLGIRETHTCTQDKLWRLPEGVSPADAVCLDPADYALCGVRDGSVGVGDRVAVFGLGAIGLMAVQLLRVAGATDILAVDPVAKRRDAALQLGATAAFDPRDAGFALDAKERTGGGVDVAIEISGNIHALNDAIRVTRFGGTIATVGLYRGQAKGLELGWEWHFNRQNIVASRSMSEPNREHPRWDRARLRATIMELFRRKRITSDGIVEPVVPFDQAADAYMEILRDASAGIKLAVTYGERSSMPDPVS